MPKLKKLKQGDPFPYDFWNYNINPVVGYSYELKKKDKEFWKYQQPTNQ